MNPHNVQQMKNNFHSQESQFSKEPNQNYSLGPQRFNPIEPFDDIMRNDDHESKTTNNFTQLTRLITI